MSSPAVGTSLHRQAPRTAGAATRRRGVSFNEQVQCIEFEPDGWPCEDGVGDGANVDDTTLPASMTNDSRDGGSEDDVARWVNADDVVGDEVNRALVSLLNGAAGGPPRVRRSHGSVSDGGDVTCVDGEGEGAAGRRRVVAVSASGHGRTGGSKENHGSPNRHFDCWRRSSEFTPADGATCPSARDKVLCHEAASAGGDSSRVSDGGASGVAIAAAAGSNGRRELGGSVSTAGRADALTERAATITGYASVPVVTAPKHATPAVPRGSDRRSGPSTADAAPLPHTRPVRGRAVTAQATRTRVGGSQITPPSIRRGAAAATSVTGDRPRVQGREFSDGGGRTGTPGLGRGSSSAGSSRDHVTSTTVAGRGRGSSGGNRSAGRVDLPRRSAAGEVGVPDNTTDLGSSGNGNDDNDDANDDVTNDDDVPEVTGGTTHMDMVLLRSRKSISQQGCRDVTRCRCCGLLCRCVVLWSHHHDHDRLCGTSQSRCDCFTESRRR